MFRSSQALVCRDCGADALRLLDGVFVCGECGTQSQDILDEQTEWTAGINTTQRGGVRKRRGIARAKKPAPPTVAPRAAALAYADGLQRMLAAQTDALVSAGEAPAALRPVVRRIWAAYVAMSAVFDVQAPPKRKRGADGGTGGAGAAAAEEEADSGSDDDDPALRPRGRASRGGNTAPPPVIAGSQLLHSLMEEDEEEEEEDDAAPAAPKALRRLTTQLHERLPLLTPLAVLYLGCLWLRCAVLPADVCARAADGRLPYLGFHATLPADVARDAPPGALAPSAPPGPRRLAAAVAAVAAALRLPLPPANGPALAARLAAQLTLPVAAGRAAARMLLLYDPAALRLAPTAGEAASRGLAAETHVAAVLLFALKVVYGLGLAPGRAAGAGVDVSDASGWARWAAARRDERAAEARRAALLRGGPAAAAALLSGDALPSYDTLLRRHVFAGAAPPRAAAASAAARLAALGAPAMRPAGPPRYRPPVLPAWVPAPLPAPLPHVIWRDPASGGADYEAVLAEVASRVGAAPAAVHKALLQMEERAVAAEAAAAVERGAPVPGQAQQAPATQLLLLGPPGSDDDDDKALEDEEEEDDDEDGEDVPLHTPSAHAMDDD